MHAVARLIAAGACALALGSAVHAQVRHVKPAANPIPSAAARAAQAAPNPSGLRPTFPAGLTSGSGSRVSSDPIAATASPIIPAARPVDATPFVPRITDPGRVPLVPVVPGIVNPISPELPSFAPATNVLGAGATVPGPAQRLESGAGGYSAVDQARSFFFADADHDGDLTRAEARRLTIMTMPFEQMDRNFDGLISRFEYEDSLR